MAHLDKVGDNWFVFGIALGVPHKKLREIEISFSQGGVKRFVVEMIQYWLDTTPSACWKEVARALEQVDCLALASAIKKEYLWGHDEQPTEPINCKA